MVRFQQHVYKYLLQRYLLLKYRSEGEAKAKYSRLLKTIEYLHVLFASNKQNVIEENVMEKGRWHSEFERLGL